MTWTDPAAKDFVDGNALTAAELDTYVLANSLYLYDKVAEQRTDFPLSPATGKIVIRTDVPAIYRWNGSTWVSLSGGVGTVTSIAISDDTGILDIDPASAITSSGTFTIALLGQSANTVFAGPTTDPAVEPSFRALVAADIPNLSSVYQPTDADLTAIAALSSTGLAARTAANTWAQRAITGTTNRVDVTNGNGVSGNPTIDISASYAGQNTITTVGTVATGTWNATAIGVAKGGTGADLSATGGANQIVRQNSAGGAFTVSALARADLPAHNGCRVYNNANISIGNAATQFVTFNSERYDTDSIHSTSVNTGRLTIPFAGKWLVTCAVSFAANATGARAIQIWLNAATVIATTFVPAVGGGTLTTDIAVSTVYQFAANDYLELGVYQSSGGNLNLLYGAGYSPEFAVAFLGKD